LGGAAILGGRVLAGDILTIKALGNPNEVGYTEQSLVQGYTHGGEERIGHVDSMVGAYEYASFSGARNLLVLNIGTG
jgi:hypothetical protein